MDGYGVARGYGGIVEEAEAHRRRAFGMVAGRPHRDEGVVDVTAHDFVDRLTGAADGVERRLQRAGAHGRVAVQPGETVAWRGLLQRLNIGFRMDAQSQFARALWGLVADQRHELFVFENPFDHSNAIRPFGMAGPIVVRETGRMGNQQCIQCKPTNSVVPLAEPGVATLICSKACGRILRGEFSHSSIAPFRAAVQRRLRIKTKVYELGWSGRWASELSGFAVEVAAFRDTVARQPQEVLFSALFQ